MHPIIELFIAKGAVASGRHSLAEVHAASAQLSISLPDEFHTYFSSFRECKFPDLGWEVFDVPHCIERTLEYRQHYSRIHGKGFEVPVSSVFAFCDYLIDAPTYFVVAEPKNRLFGYIVGTHSEDGWIAGSNLADFHKAFEHDWEIGIIMNEK